jgi:hypothetical protein
MKSKILISILAALLIAGPAALAQDDDLIPDASDDMALADTEAPSDVENVVAIAGDGEVTLTWDVASDNTAVAGYKVYYGIDSVSEDGGEYANVEDVGNKISHTISGLDNNVEYFFAVTAYDDSDNESINYSVEVSTMPMAGASDAEAPQVASADPVYSTKVRVVFSEEIILPETNPEAAFSIKEDLSSNPLEVIMAEMDPEDIENKSVILTTEPQTAGESYIVTVGIQVEDTAGNPIVSGTSDTAIFLGTDVAEPEEEEEPEIPEDTTPPELINVVAPDNFTVIVTFSEPVILPFDELETFIITEEENWANLLEVTDVQLSDDGTTVTATTAEQQPLNYNLVVGGVADVAGNLISLDNNATVFFGGVAPDIEEEEEGEDTTAPEDVTNLAARAVGAMMARLTWTGSANTAGDLAHYIFYKSTDGEVYGEGVILDVDAESFDVSDIMSDVTYFFKVTAVDALGNESEGAIATFVLPGTGPEVLFLLGGSLGLGRFFSRRKKSKK